MDEEVEKNVSHELLTLEGIHRTRVIILLIELCAGRSDIKKTVIIMYRQVTLMMMEH